MTLRISIDRTLCIGSESCVRLVPGTFELDEEFVAIVIDPTTATEEQLRSAELNCPSGAISVEES